MVVHWFVGVDEVGRGPLAGPLVVGAFAQRLGGDRPAACHATDSKKLGDDERRRIVAEELMPMLQAEDAFYCDVWASPYEIDRLGILKAWKAAVALSVSGVAEALGRSALSQGGVTVARLVVDGSLVEWDPDDFWPTDVLQGEFLGTAKAGAALLQKQGESIPKADESFWYVGAASILAKVARDNRMLLEHRNHPEYGFDRHKGYGTAAHIAKMREHGLVPGLHRSTFVPRSLRGREKWRTS